MFCVAVFYLVAHIYLNTCFLLSETPSIRVFSVSFFPNELRIFKCFDSFHFVQRSRCLFGFNVLSVSVAYV